MYNFDRWPKKYDVVVKNDSKIYTNKYKRVDFNQGRTYQSSIN